MPLVNCPECSNSLSDKASCCPKCGYDRLNMIKCFECQTSYNETIQECTNCGCPTEINIRERYNTFVNILKSAEQRMKAENIDNVLQGNDAPVSPMPTVGTQAATINSISKIDSKSNNNKWNVLLMFAYALVSIAIPIAGICIGIYGLTQDGKRAQGCILIVISIVMFFQYWVLLSLFL